VIEIGDLESDENMRKLTELGDILSRTSLLVNESSQT
jgi:hypothetical protein